MVYLQYKGEINIVDNKNLKRNIEVDSKIRFWYIDFGYDISR